MQKTNTWKYYLAIIAAFNATENNYRMIHLQRIYW